MRRSSSTFERGQIQPPAKFHHKTGRFLQFSEQAAMKAARQWQQHHFLSQISGALDGTLLTLSHIAEVMKLRPYTRVTGIRSGLIQPLTHPGKSTPQTALVTPSR